MTALSANRATEFIGEARTWRTFPIVADAVIYAGALVGINTDGFLEPASADATLKIVGIACTEKDATGLADGDIEVEVDARTCVLVNGSSSITANDVESLCYAVDDQTVHLSDGSSAGTAQVTRGDVTFNGTDLVGLAVDSLPDLTVPSNTSDDQTAADLRDKWNNSAQHFAAALATIDTSGAESWIILAFKDSGAAAHTVAAVSPATADVVTITNTTARVAPVAASRPVAGRIHQVSSRGVYVRPLD